MPAVLPETESVWIVERVFRVDIVVDGPVGIALVALCDRRAAVASGNWSVARPPARPAFRENETGARGRCYRFFRRRSWTLFSYRGLRSAMRSSLCIPGQRRPINGDRSSAGDGAIPVGLRSQRTGWPRVTHRCSPSATPQAKRRGRPALASAARRRRCLPARGRRAWPRTVCR